MSDGDRTHDRRNHNPELYQLSYAHHCIDPIERPHSSRPPNLARPAGLEPATHGLEGRCSIRLSYGRTLANLVLVLDIAALLQLIPA